jgi:pimeloyl-ACP methyl ester carboxylesterase
MPLLGLSIGTIEVLTWGSGSEHLLILHASATGPRALTGLACALQKPDRQIIAPAFQGYGETRLLETAAGRHTHGNVAIANEVLDKVRGTRRIVFGHSMGGLIALLIALDQSRRGKPLDALVLYEPILRGLLEHRSNADAEVLAWDRGIISLLSRNVREGDAEAGVRRFVEAWNDVMWCDLPETVRRQLILGADNLVLETSSMRSQSIPRSILTAFDTPTLLLRGNQAPEFVRRVAVRTLKLLPSAYEIVLSGCGHMGPIDSPELVASQINQFLENVRRT